MGGVLFMVAPGFALKIFLSNGNYPEIILRLLGVFFLSLAIVITGIVYYKTEVLYPVTLIVRLFIISALQFFYYYSKDNMFLMLTGVVGLGILLTGISYLVERNMIKNTGSRIKNLSSNKK